MPNKVAVFYIIFFFSNHEKVWTFKICVLKKSETMAGFTFPHKETWAVHIFQGSAQVLWSVRSWWTSQQLQLIQCSAVCMKCSDVSSVDFIDHLVWTTVRGSGVAFVCSLCVTLAGSYITDDLLGPQHSHCDYWAIDVDMNLGLCTHTHTHTQAATWQLAMWSAAWTLMNVSPKGSGVSEQMCVFHVLCVC